MHVVNKAATQPSAGGVALVCLLLFAACSKTPDSGGFDLYERLADGDEAGLAFPRPAEPRPVTVDGELRPAVVTESSGWSWTGVIPRNARLLVGLHPVPTKKKSATFPSTRVIVHRDGRAEIMAVLKGPANGAPGWVDAEIDLSPYGGRTVTLELRPDSTSGGSQRLAWSPVRITGPPRSGEGRPNILLVVVDTLRFDRLGSYGYGRATSPEIDRRIARKGVVLESAYSQSPWTLPSMISLMTSRHPGELLGDDPTTYGLPPGLETLPQRLGSLGYRTAGFVANALLHPGNNFARGFETYYSAPRQRDHRRHAENVTSRASAWLRAYRTEPFFLYLHFMDPHDPYDNADLVNARSPFYPGYDGPMVGRSFSEFIEGEKDRNDPTVGVPAEDVAHWSALYDSEVRYMDRELGKFLALIPADVLANTLVVFTADHGEELYDHGWWLHARTVFEELIRVPLIVRWDRAIPADRRIEGTVRLLDLAPTLVAAAAGEPVPGWQGVDLLPALTSDRPLPRLAAFASASTKNRPLRAGLVLDGFKLTLFNRNERQFEPDRNQRIALEVDRRRLPYEALYDLARDPREGHNLLLTDPSGGGRRRRMERLIHIQLNRQIDGLRVIAGGLTPGHRLSGTLRLANTPEGWFSYFLEAGDRVEHDGSELRFELTGNSFEKGFIVLGDPGIIKHVEVRIDGEAAGDAAIRLGGRPWTGSPAPGSLEHPGWPVETARPGLHIWYRTAGRTQLADQEGETRKRLEALGYL